MNSYRLSGWLSRLGRCSSGGCMAPELVLWVIDFTGRVNHTHTAGSSPVTLLRGLGSCRDESDALRLGESFRAITGN